jgi:hypothetical protein
MSGRGGTIVDVSEDFSTYPTGQTGWCALIDHAIALGGDISEVEWFELKDRLSFGTRPDRKASAFILAKAIIGMANRMPDAAARHVGGHGVILVGLKDGAVVDAESVDGAMLQDAVGPYITQAGLGWDHQFIQHPNGLVMAVTVNPPKAGDAIFTLRKEYSAGDKTYREGTVFVRLPGQTRQAKSVDLENLQRRLLAAPEASLELELEFDRGFDCVDIGSAVTWLERCINRLADDRVADAEPSSPTVEVLLKSLQGRREAFLRAVERWRAEALGMAREVALEMVRHKFALVHLKLANRSDHFMDGVDVRIEFPAEVTVLVRSDTDYRDRGRSFDVNQLLPTPPKRYEDYSQYDLGMTPSLLSSIHPVAPYIPPMSDLHLEASEGRGAILTWDVGTLRGRRTEPSQDTIAILVTSPPAPLTVDWQATAKGVHHVFSGRLHVPCAHEDDLVTTWDFKGESDDGQQAG